MKQGWILAEVQDDGWHWRLFDPAAELARSTTSGPEVIAQLATQLPGAGAVQVIVLGHAEAPMRALPCSPLPPAHLDGPLGLPASDRKDVVWQLIPQLAQAAPAELSAGAELVLAGALQIAPKFDGVVLVRRHGRALWAHVSAGEVVSMQSALTAPLLALLAPGRLDLPAQQQLLLDAAAETMSRPERLAARLGSLAARQRLDQTSPAEATALAAGWLLGAELAASKPLWLGQNLLLISEAEDGCSAVLAAQGLTPHHLPETAALLAAFKTLAPLVPGAVEPPV